MTVARHDFQPSIDTIDYVRAVSELEQSCGYVYDDDLMAWVAAKQSVVSTDNLTVAGSMAVTNMIPAVETGLATQASLAVVKTNTDKVVLTPASGSVSSSGNNTCVTPTSGKKLQVSYYAYNPSAAVECGFRFGASGVLQLRNSLTTGGAIVMKDFGDRRCVEGAVNEALVLNLSSAVPTIWNALYVEV